MTDVLIDNFDELYPRIETAVKNAKFIAIDTEFTALYTTLNNKRSLFDTPEERYKKLCQTVSQIIPIQVGLTAFRFDIERAAYFGETFNFYICPTAFGNINPSMLFTASSFQFLCRYNFDYNKLIYYGLPYLNTQQEQSLQNEMKSQTLDMECSDIENKLDEVLLALSAWFYKSQIGDIFDLSEYIKNDRNNIETIYLAHKFFRIRFANTLWTYEESGKLLARKVTIEEFLLLSKEEDIDSKTLKKLLGFTRIYRLLSNSKKPLVGHNLFMDLLLLCNSFENPLPPSYKEFKKLIHTHFPVIYDTKTISFSLRSKLPKNKEWKTSILGILYEYFKDSHGRHLAFNSPLIQLENSDVNDQIHNAGWDSYCTGYIFIRMAHILATENIANIERDVTSTEHFAAVQQFTNEINLIRCTVSSVILDGDDPKSRRPPCFIIESLKEPSISISQLTSTLSTYGYVEVKSFARNKVIVAVDNFGSANRILRYLKTNKNYKIQQYNLIKHSKWGKFMLVGGFLLSLGVIATAIRKS